MMKALFTIIICTISYYACAAQDTTRMAAPDFAIVLMNFGFSKCDLKYSDGTSENLMEKLALQLPNNFYRRDNKKNYSSKFKMLQYMYSRGYILLSATELYGHNTGFEYYFKHQ